MSAARHGLAPQVGLLPSDVVTASFRWWCHHLAMGNHRSSDDSGKLSTSFEDSSGTAAGAAPRVTRLQTTLFGAA
ncbi:hypothetical protein PVL29_019707 [Vitis rotundifolia]|uniref:Uncharacterized protein n=1 Tax=Vitis rotundifolia TaxID=103349 RepID=A0AA38Z1L9_VITRO|nr:hypothetical protein PVL29_019707 [Vitis rotundifolia]